MDTATRNQTRTDCPNTIAMMRTLVSELSEIPGIGPKRQRALLEHFGSVRALRAASPAEIAAVPGFSRALATIVREALGE